MVAPQGGTSGASREAVGVPCEVPLVLSLWRRGQSAGVSPAGVIPSLSWQGVCQLSHVTSLAVSVTLL